MLDLEILLASRSPRRRQLISQLDLPVQILDVDVDETITEPLSPQQTVEVLSARKAAACAFLKLTPRQVVVAADTVVAFEGSILGKPKGEEQARQMLQMLSGKTHEVYTGVSLLGTEAQRTFSECTSVTFRPLQSSEIDYYIQHYRPFDKAGSYGIQEWIGMVAVSRLEGCYYNVMGLPLAHLYQELSRFSTR